MSHYTQGGFKTFTATADIPAYTAVKLSGKNIVPAAAATDVILGTIHAAVKANWQTDVRLRNASGTMNIKLAGTVATGNPITSDGAGLGIVTSTAGHQIIGYALEAGAAGDIIEILPSTAKF